MGTGTSNVSKGGKGKTSGSKYQNFMRMSDDEKASTIASILNDSSIQVPDYLDDSDFTKVLYGLGMTEKPQVVSDAALDKMAGTDIFRTVYDAPDVGAEDIFTQIAKGDYTQVSGSGGSVHGKAIYFADNFGASAAYGRGRPGALIMRGKLKSDAKVISEWDLFDKVNTGAGNGDKLALECIKRGQNSLGLYALAKGYAAYTDSGYTMVVNRGAMAMSNTAKKLDGTRGIFASNWGSYNGSNVNMK